MEMLLLAVLALIAGFIGLVGSSDRFVEGAANTALILGISPLIIGLTIVAFGTSAPEIFTSAAAALSGSPELAISNVIGSNIANIGLILGFTLLVSEVKIPVSMLKLELPFMVLVSLLFFPILMDGSINMVDGFLMLATLGLFSWLMYRSNLSTLTGESGTVGVQPGEPSLPKSLLTMLIALVVMVISARVLVWGASNVAMALGVSELVIGLTIVAIGTSLPELATSMASARRGHHELAIGNVVGSNILNLVIVLPLPAFLTGIAVGPQVLTRDYPAMVFFTLLMAGLFYRQRKSSGKIGRKSGVVFIIFYLAYTALLILASTTS